MLTEINRQAQAIGLNQGGTFAKALNVFIGGGEASGTTTATQNGTRFGEFGAVHRGLQEPGTRRAWWRPA